MARFVLLDLFRKKTSNTESTSQTELESRNSRFTGQQLFDSINWLTRNKIFSFLIGNFLLVSTIVGAIVGLVLGLALNARYTFTPPAIIYFGFLGEIFLRVLKLLILPLVSTGIICGVGKLGKNKAKITIRTFILFLITLLIAVLIGLILVAIIRPGYLNRNGPYSLVSQSSSTQYYEPIVSVLDIIRNLFPDNVIAMCFLLYQTVLTPHYSNNTYNQSVQSSNESNYSTQTITEIDYYNQSAGRSFNINVLGLVVFCLFFGIVLGRMGEKAKVLIDLLEIINEASMHMVETVIWFSPIAIASLISSAILNMANPQETFKSISFYVLTIFIGLFIQAVIVLPAIFIFITRRNIFKFLSNTSEALIVAFASASSIATLPITFRCTEEKARISSRITRFVLPLGTVMNLDGTALYEAVGAIFIAQINDYNLTFGDYVLTFVTATLAACGASGIPSAGLVTMVIVLGALNVPQDKIYIIYAVDWLLDRMRTTVNVWSHCVLAACVAHLSQNDILVLAQENQQPIEFQNPVFQQNPNDNETERRSQETELNTQFGSINRNSGINDTSDE